MSKNSSEATGKLRMSVLRMVRVNCNYQRVNCDYL